MNHSIAYVNERSTIKANYLENGKRYQNDSFKRFEISMSSFIPRNLTDIEAVAGCTFACTGNTLFRMFSCLQINCQPFYLRQLLKFHPFDWLIEIYLQTEGQGTHPKMVSFQPMPGFSPLFAGRSIKNSDREKSDFKNATSRDQIMYKAKSL